MENVTGIYIQDSQYSGLKIITVEKIVGNTFLVQQTDNEDQTIWGILSFFLNKRDVKLWIKKGNWIKFDELSSIEGTL